MSVWTSTVLLELRCYDGYAMHALRLGRLARSAGKGGTMASHVSSSGPPRHGNRGCNLEFRERPSRMPEFLQQSKSFFQCNVLQQRPLCRSRRQLRQAPYKSHPGYRSLVASLLTARSRGTV